MNKITVRTNNKLHEETFTVRHKSGLEIFLTPKDLKTSYAVLSVGYGALHTDFKTPDGILHKTPAGIAHFLEHKMFEMPDGTDAFEQFAAIGANANAYTSASRTSYLFSCTSRLEEALEILLTMVFTPHFTESSVKREADIIKQEVLAYEDQAPSRLFRILMNNLFEKHGLRENICGTVESISRITPALLYECYHAFYTPKNMALSISGAFSPEEIFALIDRILEKLQVAANDCAIAEIINERGGIVSAYKEISMSVARPILQIGIKDIAYQEDQLFMTKRHLLMNIALNAITGAASPLYETLLNDGLLQDKFSTDYGDEDGCAYALIAAESDDARRVIDETFKALENAAQKPPSAEEFERLRRCVYADYVRLFDSTEDIAEETLDNFFTGIELLSVGDIILSLTYEDFASLCREIFRPQYFTAAVVRPLEGSAENERSSQ